MKKNRLDRTFWSLLLLCLAQNIMAFDEMGTDGDISGFIGLTPRQWAQTLGPEVKAPAPCVFKPITLPEYKLNTTLVLDRWTPSLARSVEMDLSKFKMCPVNFDMDADVNQDSASAYPAQTAIHSESRSYGLADLTRWIGSFWNSSAPVAAPTVTTSGCPSEIEIKMEEAHEDTIQTVEQRDVVAHVTSELDSDRYELTVVRDGRNGEILYFLSTEIAGKNIGHQVRIFPSELKGDGKWVREDRGHKLVKFSSDEFDAQNGGKIAITYLHDGSLWPSRDVYKSEEFKMSADPQTKKMQLKKEGMPSAVGTLHMKNHYFGGGSSGVPNGVDSIHVIY